MQALKGATRIAFIGFFVSHIVFTVIVDSQAIFPSSFVPQILQDLLTWYVTALNDPLMATPRKLLWFQSLICCEMLFQLPFFFVAVNMLSSSDRTEYPDWFRIQCVAYGSHTATTMVPILAALSTNTNATLFGRLLILLVYFPYLIFPLWILFLAATRSSLNAKDKFL